METLASEIVHTGRIPHLNRLKVDCGAGGNVAPRIAFFTVKAARRRFAGTNRSQGSILPCGFWKSNLSLRRALGVVVPERASVSRS